MSSFIRATNLEFKYDQKPIIQDISFSLAKGETLSLVGPSGCGKSTLLKIIGLMLKPVHGTLENEAQRIAYVSQEDGLLSWLTVLENVLLPLSLRNEKIDHKQRRDALTALEQVGLQGYQNFYPHQLSGGMKKRVEIARALHYEPDLLLFDEPFSALDIITRERLNVLCKQITQIKHITTVLVTHSMDEACYFADQLILLAPAPAFKLSQVHLTQESSVTEQFKLSEEQEQFSKELKSKLFEATQVKQEQPEPPLLKKRSLRRRSLSAVGLLLEITAILGLISLFKKLGNIPDFILPYPITVARLFFSSITEGFIFHNIGYTVSESLGGFTLALVTTIPLAYFISKASHLRRYFMSPLVIINAMPIVALAPFLVVWFGLGLQSKIATTFLVVFFPLLISSIQGFTLAKTKTAIYDQLYKPSGLRALLKLELPAALPVIYSGIKVSLTSSVMGAVVGEFVSGAEGLGSALSIAKANFNTPMMFVNLTWLVILSLTYYALAVTVEKKFLKKLYY